MRTVAIVLPGIVADFVVNDVPTAHQGRTGPEGYAELQLSDLPVTDIEVTAAGYKPYRADAVRVPPGSLQFRIGVGPDPGRPQDVLLPALEPIGPSIAVPRINGRQFVNARGDRTVLVIASGFRVLERLIKGEDLGPLYRQWRALDFDWIRVFLSYCVDDRGNGIGRLMPREYDYADVRRCALELNAQGFGMYATFLADAQRVFDSGGEQREHWERGGEALQGTVAVASVGNEHGDWRRGDFGKNGFNPGEFIRLPGLLCSRGAGVEDVPCFDPDLDFAEFRNRRDQPAMENDAVASAVALRAGGAAVKRGPVAVPLVFDECTKWGPGKETDGDLAERLGGIYAIEAAGLCFHSAEGVDGRVMGDETAELAARWTSAARRQF